MSWFCIYSDISAEFRALAGLREKQFTVYMPVAVRINRRNGRAVEHRRPLLARYLFVQLADFTRWHDLKAVRGVQEILPHEHEPVPVPAREIARLQEREQAGEFRFAATETGRRRERTVLRSLKELAFLHRGDNAYAN